MSQHAKQKTAAELKSDIVHFIVYTCSSPTSTCQNVFLPVDIRKAARSAPSSLFTTSVSVTVTMKCRWLINQELWLHTQLRQSSTALHQSTLWSEILELFPTQREPTEYRGLKPRSDQHCDSSHERQLTLFHDPHQGWTLVRCSEAFAFMIQTIKRHLTIIWCLKGVDSHSNSIQFLLYDYCSQKYHSNNNTITLLIKLYWNTTRV